MIETGIERKVMGLCDAIISASKEQQQSHDKYRMAVIDELHALHFSDVEICDLLAEILTRDRREMERLVIKWMGEFGFAVEGDPLGIVSDLLTWLKSRDPRQP